MRHNVFGRKLNRDIKERKALYRQLIQSLILHGKVETTVAKAKAIRGLVEKLVTYGQEGSSAALRKISSLLVRKDTIDRFMKDIAPRFKERIGGYVRLIRTSTRRGDNAQKATLEWTIDDMEKKPQERALKEKQSKAPNKKETS